MRPADRREYDVVLPDLTQAFDIAREWTHAGFDPRAVARAELGWWVARRIPGESSVRNVGERIADLNAVFYEVDRARVLEAGLLRATASDLRDQGGARADWPRIHTLLVRSYRSLHAGVRPDRPGR
jgi:hypothetical protein